MAKQTPSQTVGPYLHMGLIRGPQNTLDGEGQPISDAMVEIWQANSHGRYNHPDDDQEKPLDENFKGFGRAATNSDGAYWFETIKPGPVPGPGNALQAPHLNVTLFARGMLLHAITRIYFADESANDIDPVLNSIEDEARRRTLIAKKDEAGYRFDIIVQGADETVFFEA